MVAIGVVGLRNVGLNHCRRAREVAGCELVALADADEERLAAAEEEFAIDRGSLNAAELFADPEVDGVVLALPNHLHELLAVEALEAGKHVLVEKPMARTVDECERMIAARDAAGKVLMVGMNQRFAEPVARAKAFVTAGEIGAVRRMRCWWNRRHMGKGVFGRGAWGFDPAASGGGPMADLGVHKLDQGLHVIGFPEIVAVDGQAWYGQGQAVAAEHGVDYAIEDAAIGTLRGAGGEWVQVEAAYFGAWRDEPGQGLLIEGDRGGLELAGGLRCWHVDGDDPVPVDPPVASSESSCVEHFVRVLAGDAELSPTAEQGRDLVRYLRAIYDSHEAGAPVAV